jgi:thymidylate synthase
MRDVVRFLHITDTHLKPVGSAFSPDDRKVDAKLEEQSREKAVEDTLARLSEGLKEAGQCLDGVIFCGDALSAGQPGGDELLFKLLLKHLGPHGIEANRIVAVPGNHDVPMGALPGSTDRYTDFIKVWRNAGCKTPWLDGVDASKYDLSSHALIGPDNEWMVLAINSCNWSHTDAVPKGLAKLWDSIPGMLAKGDAGLEKELRQELDKLARYDMARVSPAQMEAMRIMLRSAPTAKSGRQLRMMALHHHLRVPSHREEVKPFADMVNLEQVRTFIAQQTIQVLLHGHKHEERLHFDFIEEPMKPTLHRVLMVAGATFDSTRYQDAMRVVEISGLPWAPALQTKAHAVPRGGMETWSTNSPLKRLWDPIEAPLGAPVVIQGSNFDEVYARVQALSEDELKERTLVVQLDLSDFSAVQRLPDTYPTHLTTVEARAEWLDQLVNWWQLPQSQLQDRIPYIHGNRLRRYGSNIDQVKRVRELLSSGQTSRAIAVLIDPTADFKEGNCRPEFASFCLVQFLKRAAGRSMYVDCVAYYRAQEMVKWWPINVAELHWLLTQIAPPIGATPGRITTVTPVPRVIARAPTHVAMPSVDRWLDQSPEKFFVLATALLNGRASSDPERKALDEWVATFKELAVAAVDIAPDGGPVVAIEGPLRLARYLKSGSGPNAEVCGLLAKTLEEVARMGSEPPPATEVERRKQWGKRLEELLLEAVGVCSKLGAEQNSS